ncbi:MAG: bacteriorhodopsin [Halobacteriales archaeon]
METLSEESERLYRALDRFETDVEEATGDAAAERPALVRSLFRKLRNLAVVVWSFYPVGWLAGPYEFGVVDTASEELLITHMDLIAKVAFGFIAFNSRRAFERLPELDALQGLASGR